MKKLYILYFVALFTSTADGQNWVNGGNTLSANGTIGTNSSHSLLFETSGIERGRITNGGNWAIGSTGTTSRFTVNAVSGASPFRAQVNGGTKLLVNANGGISIGSPNAAPSNGLFVEGNVGIGTSTPVRKLEIVEGEIRIQATTSSRYFEFLKTGTQIDWRLGHVSKFLDVYSSIDDFATSNLRAYFESASSSSFVFHVLGRSIGNEWVVSDRRLKKDFGSIPDALALINKLQARTYFFDTAAHHGLGLPTEKQHGFIAQEIEEVFPTMVTETELRSTDETSGEIKLQKLKVVNYKELIPVLAQGIKELDSVVRDRDERIALLEEKLDEVLTLLDRDRLNSGTAWMKQNTPNPVFRNTIIQYSIPTSSHSARILFTNSHGQQLRFYNVMGAGTINFSVGTLPSGIYHYSLVVDGKTISSKKLVIAR